MLSVASSRRSCYRQGMRKQVAAALTAVCVVALGGQAAEPSSAASGVGKPWPQSPDDKIVRISGVYPHLAVFNGNGECGIGAVVPWAGKLWFITYPPHAPKGGEDKLYTVDKKLSLEIRPESVGGTHANRMIHP